MGFSRQEYWSGLPFPPPVDHILSELLTMSCLPWVALHGNSHSFTESHKPLHHDKAVIHEEEGCPNLCTLWSFSRIEAFQWWQSQFSGLSWVSIFTSVRMYKISLFHWFFEFGHCYTFVSQVQFMTQGLLWLPLIDEVYVKPTSSGRSLPGLHLGFN